MQSTFQSIILGIVQGLTEFLPVSSTAHLRIIPALAKWKDPGAAFSAVIQLGTMFAILIYFWKDLIKIYLQTKSKIGLWIIFGTIPICIFGFVFKNEIEVGFVRNLKLISLCLIFFGLLMFFTDLIARQKKQIKDINFIDVMLIGLAQSLALFPGVSRSAITIVAGLLLGFKRYDAARFSFLLSIPAILASGILELNGLLFSLNGIQNISWSNLIIGTIASCISGYFAIDFLLKYLQTHKTYVFVFYRILLGIMVLYLNYKGIIQ